MRTLALTLGVLFACGGTAVADAIDGSTANWGAIATQAGDDRKLDISLAPGVSAFIEDTGSENYVGPGRGGQDYDVEVVLLKWTGSVLSGGLLTGFDLMNGELRSSSSQQKFYAGDFFLDFGCDGLFDAALDFSSYSSGSIHLVLLEGDNSDVEQVYYPSHSAANPWRWDPHLGGSAIGSVSAYIGQATDLTGDHQFFEFSFDLADYPVLPASAICIHGQWTMECGNDHGGTRVPNPTPEPVSIVLVGAALAFVSWRRLRKHRA